MKKNRSMSKYKKSLLILGLGLTIPSLIAWCFLLVGCGSWKKQDPWSHNNKIAAGAYIAGRATDVWSTAYAIDAGCVEVNPLLGDDPDTGKLIAYQVIGIGILGVIAHYLPEKYRTWVLGVGAGFGFAVSARNINKAKQ